MRIVFFIIFFYSYNLLADTTLGENSGKPLPRFISLKSSEANLRIGPSKDYQKVLKYTYKNIPLMVVDEIDQWRKIVDWNSNEGWIHLSLLSNKRFGIINKKKNKYADVFSKPNGRLKGQIGSGNIVKLNKCVDKWCKIKIDKYSGWIKKIKIWGVFEDEDFD